MVPGLLLVPAQETSTPHSRVTLVNSVRAAAPGKPFTVGVRIDLEPEWHTYWSNSGDAGSPTTVAWTLPKGWKVSGPRFPTPHRLESGGIVSFGYEGSATLLYTITPSANAKTSALRAQVDFLVCKETCIPASAKLPLRVTVGKQAVPGTSLAAEEALVPKRDAHLAGSVLATPAGYRLSLVHAAVGLRPEGIRFFPADAGVLNHNVLPTFRLSTAKIEADLPKSPYASGTAKRLRGVLVLSEGGPSLLVDLPVTKPE